MRHRLKSVLFVVICFLMANHGSGQPKPEDTFTLFRVYDLNPKAQTDENYKKLTENFEGEKSPQIKAKKAFALGVAAYKRADFFKAANYLGESLSLNTHLDDYAHYYIGLIEKEAKDLNGAKLHFMAVKNHEPQSSREADAEMELAQIAKIQNRWREAYDLLAHLERRHRSDPQYQDILYNLAEAAVETHHTYEFCKAVTKIYTKFAGFSLTKHWGFDLSKVKIGNHNVNCSVNVHDRERRMDHLLLAGEFEEVHTELADWKAWNDKNPSKNEGELEIQKAQLSLAEGHTKEAVEILDGVSNAPSFKPNITFQMLLAKSYAKNDDYHKAVEAYLKASTMGLKFGKRPTPAQKALFQAAFLSYQYRDYDGAQRHFEEIVQWSRGQFAWDARWHLAWIRYLKHDYEGAKKDFAQLTLHKQFSTVDMEKLTYWQAMAEYRDGHIAEARDLFTQLANRSRLGYYTGAAMARLASLPAVSTAQTPAEAKRKPSSEENLPADKEVEKLGETAQPEEDDEITDGGFELAPPITPLKSQAMVERFDRAKDFIDLGFHSWAILELREIEKRTSNRQYLQSLVSEYAKAGEYFRSATIADTVFEEDRVKGGIDGAQALWTYAFPQAFSRYVVADAKKADVTPPIIWAVIRGESGFREDVHSGAGAMGLMQLIPPTARRMAKQAGVDNFSNKMLLSPETNILLGAFYIHRLDKVMSHSLPLVVASYNAGPHRVQGWLKDFGDLDTDEFVEHIPYVETRNYVKKVLRNYMIYEILYERKTNILKFLSQKLAVKFDGPRPTAESWDEIKE